MAVPLVRHGDRHVSAAPQSTPGATPAASVAARPSASAASSSAVAAKLSGPVLNALLARRTSALEHGDLKAFLADVDPTNARFIAAQTSVFSALRTVHATDASWRTLIGAVPRADLEARWHVPAAQAIVGFNYRLDGFDTRPVARQQIFTLVERDGVWRITDDPNADGERPAGSVLDPWDEGPVAVVRRPDVLVVGSVADRARLGRVADTAEAALSNVSAMWPKGWSKRAVLYAPRGAAFRVEYFDALTPTLEGVEALTVPQADRLGVSSSGVRPRFAGSRVIINPATLSLTSSTLPAVFRHEFTHVATMSSTSGYTPRWLVEGIAEYTAFRGDPYLRRMPTSVFSDVARGRALTTFPSDPLFYSTPTSYDRSWLLCWYIAQRWGQGSLKSVYARMYAHPPVGAKGTDADLKAVLGVNQRDLLKGFNSWAQAHIHLA